MGMKPPTDGVYYPEIHLEPTTACQLKCRSCDRFYLENRWENRVLSRPLLETIQALAGRCGTLYLGGWGEPLCHPDIIELIRHFKDQGAKVHLSTHGVGISPQLARQLIALGIDTIRFRLAGATADIHDAIRGAGTFEAATSAMRLVAIHRTSDQTPAICVDYLLTPASLPQLPQLSALCARIGVDRIEPRHLHHLVARSQERLAIYRQPGKHGWQVMKARTAVLFSGITLTMPEMEETLTPVCGENPITRPFIAADGTVSSCPYLNPPISGEYPILFRGKRSFKRQLVMGELSRHSLDEIWNSDYYRQFRIIFSRRRAAFDQLMEETAVKSMGADVIDYRMVEVRELLEKHYPAPRPCRVCIRLHGL